MNLAGLYSKIIAKEPYNDMGVFLCCHESFEEIPLVSRYARLKYLKSNMSNERVSDFLVGLAIFILNSIRSLSLVADGKIFYAVTYTDFQVLEEEGVLIPNIFVYPEPASIAFLEEVRRNHAAETSRELMEVRKHFSRCYLEDAFDFYESRFFDEFSSEDVVRVFAVAKKSEKVLDRVE